MHLILNYDLDTSTNTLNLLENIRHTYSQEAISQDLDHMDAKSVKRNEKEKYFHYNLSDRKDYTNGLGNMLPLPVAINRGKHNTPLVDTLAALHDENISGWIFDMAQEEFDNNCEILNGYQVPTAAFFTNRKDRLIDYFKRIVRNQKFNQSTQV